MCRKPTDDMLSVEDSICKLLEVSLRLQFAVECQAKDADFLRRGYSHPIDNYWVRRVCNASVIFFSQIGDVSVYIFPTYLNISMFI